MGNFNRGEELIGKSISAGRTHLEVFICGKNSLRTLYQQLGLPGNLYQMEELTRKFLKEGGTHGEVFEGRQMGIFQHETFKGGKNSSGSIYH